MPAVPPIYRTAIIVRLRALLDALRAVMIDGGMCRSVLIQYKRRPIRIFDRVHSGDAHDIYHRGDEDPPAGYSEERILVFDNICLCAESGRDIAHIQPVSPVFRREEFFPRHVGQFEAYVCCDSQTALFLAEEWQSG